jgi:hypothetical protein
MGTTSSREKTRMSTITMLNQGKSFGRSEKFLTVNEGYLPNQNV